MFDQFVQMVTLSFSMLIGMYRRVCADFDTILTSLKSLSLTDSLWLNLKSNV